MAGEATVIVNAPDTVDLTGLALYAISPQRAYCIAVPDEEFDHAIRVRVPNMLTVGLYRDVTPPTIRFVQPQWNAKLRERRPKILAILRDRGSGFEKSDSAMEMRIDGEWVPAAYDPEENTFAYVPPAPLRPGRHTVVIHARDRVGNERTATLRFMILQ